MSENGLMTTYKPYPVSFERGAGSWLYDAQDNAYLDAISGIAVCGLGHCHPAVTTAMQAQAQRLVHTSNLYHISTQEQLAQRLTGISGMERVFFSNSGAEANECAIKLARRYGHDRGIDDPTIIVCEQAFHGRTMATLTATGNAKVQAGFGPLVSGFVRVPFDDIEAIKAVAAEHDNIVAILVEPVQGEGGIHVPADDYLTQLRQLCDAHEWLLMLDEIQTGNGRTGQYFAFQHEGILPDVVTTAKGLGNGVPIGACLAQGKAASVLTPGSHGSTYGGNPFCCATAIAVVDTLLEQDLPTRAGTLGTHLGAALRESLSALPELVTVRGKGLMLGIELNRPCAELVDLARAEGLLINVTAERVVRLLPPLTLTDTEAAQLIERLTQVITRWSNAA